MSKPVDLTSGRLLARNTMLNLAGQVVPFLVALVAIPIVLHSIGTDAYGILSLSAMVVGYFGLFDFGLGSAATKLIAEAAGAGERQRVPDLFWTSLILMLAFGACGAILVEALSPWLVGHLFKIPPALTTEAMQVFSLLALALPFVISAGSLRGSLAAFQRFDLLNAVSVPMGVFSSVGPLLVLPFSDRPSWLVAVMVAGRIGTWIVLLALCFRVIPELRDKWRLSRATISSMLRFGGWVTVTNVVGPIMTYFDRFVIGAMISMAAVSYYYVPYQVATKVLIVPGALAGVAFAAFSGTFRRDRARTALLFERSTLFILCTMFPLVLTIVMLAPDGFRLWLNADFARNSTNVLRWLAIGVFVNGMAQMPYNLVVAAHRPDLTAKLHLTEVPFYCAFLWWILPGYGITGAAVAWALRMFVDTAVLFMLAWRLLPDARPAITRTIPLIVLATLLLCTGFIFQTFTTALPFLSVVLVLTATGTWMLVFGEDEKRMIRSYVRGAVTSASEIRKAWL